MTLPSSSQIAQIEKKSESLRNKILIRFMFQTGCSLKEAAVVKVEDVDFKKCVIRISKNNVQRFSIINEELARDIAYLVVSEKITTYLFGDDFAMSTRRIRQIVEEESLKAIGVKITPIQLRYAHIKSAFEYGVPIAEIKQQVGIGAQNILEIINDDSD